MGGFIMNKKPNLAIVGATGLVGSTFLKVLEERDFPFENLYMMASAKSAGTTLNFKGKDYLVEELNEHSFDKPIDIALFSAGGDASEKDFDSEEVKKLLAASPGVILQDDPNNSVYPLAINAAGKDEVFVGRVRRDFSVEHGINMWVVADNIRKGAATNAVQIAEKLIK